MEKEIKQLAWKQYIHYFRIWFIGLGLLIVVSGVLFAVKTFSANDVRVNQGVPEERVYDYADVLTDEEEQMLRDHIAKQERQYHIDLVLVTISEDVESQGYWDNVMMNRADDFYDQNNYGYNKVHGDGALLLDNWYEDENGSQKGSWLSTCGIVERRFGNSEIERVLNAVYYKVEKNPYEAYKAYVDKTCQLVKSERQVQIPWFIILIAPTLTAIIYAVSHLKQSPAKDTAAPNVYIAGGKPVIQAQNDQFMHKNVTTRIISTDSGGGGSGRSGGGGHHTSSGGVSHGGGGHRR